MSNPSKEGLCPMCGVDLTVSGESTDMHCDKCGRDWYYIDTGEGERMLASRQRKMRLVKPITEGAKLDDCLVPEMTALEKKELDALIEKAFKVEPSARLKMIDRIGRPPTDGEVIVIQYMRPTGQPRLMYAPCDDKELVQISRNQAISAEILQTGEVCLYSRRYDEKEEEEHIEICPNGPEVDNALKKAIRAKAHTGGTVG